MLGRRRKFDRSLRERGVPPEFEPAADRAEIMTSGPYDVSDAPEDGTEMLDFGALQIPVDPHFEVRLEMSQQGELGGVSLVRDGSVMQLGVFAAPRSGGIWSEISGDIAEEIERTGGKVEKIDGDLGPELVATLQTAGGTQPARFIGVDGPRWFFRALIAGPAAHSDARADFVNLLRRVVIDRGAEPRPVREPIMLQLPPQLAEQVEQAAAAMQDGAGSEA